MARTHVICPEWPRDDLLAAEALTAALAEGRGFVALDGWGDAHGFSFEALRAHSALTFGQEAAFAAGGTLRVRSPLEAELKIVRDGTVVAAADGARNLETPADAPGVYRVEARRAGKPWVFTNPIYLRPAGFQSRLAARSQAPAPGPD